MDRCSRTGAEAVARLSNRQTDIPLICDVQMKCASGLYLFDKFAGRCRQAANLGTVDLGARLGFPFA
jgi:CheY-like chemotaxis protein